MRGLSLVAASGGHSSSRCAGLSLRRPLLLRSTGSRRAGSVVVAHGPSCSAACGILPDQGLNPCPLHWQADSQPLRHQGSPIMVNFYLALSVFQLCYEYLIYLSSLNPRDNLKTLHWSRTSPFLYQKEKFDSKSQENLTNGEGTNLNLRNKLFLVYCANNLL